MIGELRQCEAAEAVAEEETGEAACDLDIILALDAVDAKGSAGRHVERARAVVEGLPLMSGRLRLGIVAFGKEPILIHGLRDYADPQLVNVPLAQLIVKMDDG